MTRIAIVSPAILSGDAIGHDVLHMGRVLAARGHEVELFSTTWGRAEPRSEDGIHVRTFLGDDAAALLILHHAIGWPHALPLIDSVRCRRVVKYHNVTPAHFYAGLDETQASLCRAGREQLRALIEANCDLYMADSPFNRAELLEMDASSRECVVVPPFNALADLLAADADAEVMRDYGDGTSNLLFVGRRAPNKGHRLLIDAFAVYHRRHNADSRLILLGRGEPRQAVYTRGLREQVRRLGLEGHVVFLEGATVAELKAYYQSASVFVVASEHEGFCVPVVEAMALGVPVVGYGTTAVPYTLGNAGLIWDEPDPFLLAESIDMVVRDAETRRRLIERGQRRYRERFDNRRIEDVFLHALDDLLPRSLHRSRLSMFVPRAI